MATETTTTDADLTDQLVAEIFGDAATIGGQHDDRAIIDLGIVVTDFDLKWGADLEDVVLEQVMHRAGVVYAHIPGLLVDGDQWDNPHLFVEADTASVKSHFVEVQAAAWAGTLNDERDTFVDEREGRDVTLVIPFTRRSR